jgi:hypothetical protein
MAQYLIPAVMAAFVVVIGWFITNWLTTSREHKNRQNEMRIAYLIDAYEKLTSSANRQQDETTANKMSEAVAKIQLLGNPEEIKLLHKFLDEWDRTAQTGQPKASLDPLLQELRRSLREELELLEVKSAIRWVRPLGGAR